MAPQDLNCRIFRHGVFKADVNRGVPPHASQAECEALVAAGLIHGCGKPFMAVQDGSGEVVARACGYI